MATLGRQASIVKVAVEDMLLLMNASRVAKDEFTYGGYPVPLHSFAKTEPIGFAESVPELFHGFEDLQLLTEVMPSDLVSPLNISLMGPITDGGPDTGLVAARRLRQVKRPLLPVKQYARHIVAVEQLFLDRTTGTGKTSIMYFGNNGEDWNAWIHMPKGKPLVEVDPGLVWMLRVALGLQFGRDYLWYVNLKWPGADAGVYLPTTPFGARELFKLRDYEPGKSRRAALIHWVQEHSRRIRKGTDEETEIWVREHTRGRVVFKWQDMEGAIYPSPYDLRRLAS